MLCEHFIFWVNTIYRDGPTFVKWILMLPKCKKCYQLTQKIQVTCCSGNQHNVTKLTFPCILSFQILKFELLSNEYLKCVDVMLYFCLIIIAHLYSCSSSSDLCTWDHRCALNFFSDWSCFWYTVIKSL